MSEGSQSQGSSTLDQSFEKEKDPAVQQSTSIYDDGKAAWLTVAGTYVASFIPDLWYNLIEIFTRTLQVDDTILHIRVDLCLSSFHTMASLRIGSNEVCIGLRCVPRLLYEGILEPRDTVKHKVRSVDYSSLFSLIWVFCSWIGSFQLFMQYAPGIFVGRAFDAGYL